VDKRGIALVLSGRHADIYVAALNNNVVVIYCDLNEIIAWPVSGLHSAWL